MILGNANDETSNTLTEEAGKTARSQCYEIMRTCCEDPDCKGCGSKEADEEVDDYDTEFTVDENDPNYKEVVEFIEKAKEFGANALDLSKKNLTRIPKNLLELKHLQVNDECIFFYVD